MNREKHTKLVADDLPRVSISSLKIQKILESGNMGIIDIPCNKGNFKNNVFHIVVPYQNKKYPYVVFCYSILQPDGTYRDYEYEIALDMGDCNYGGVRYWFRCPLPILGCDDRVDVLYMGIRGFFACSRCHNLTYQSRNKRGPYGLGVIDMDLVTAARDPRNWREYRGKPTKKLRRLQKMNKKFNKAQDIFNARGDSRIKKTKEKAEKIIQREKNLMSMGDHKNE